MSSLQKMFLGPLNSVSCRSCGKGVSVRWRHYLLLLVPLVLALVGMRAFELAPLQIIATALPLAILAVLIQLRLLPLAPERF